MENHLKQPSWLLTALRTLIGWQFLYEGFIKIMNTSWSAGPFLLESTWLFSPVFKSLAMNSTSLAVVDFLNTWGLTLIGIGLFFGLFTRIAAWSGALLLLLYYLARPPFTGLMEGSAVDGNQLWVNKNLIELVVLIFIARTPLYRMFGLDILLTLLIKRNYQNKVNDGSIEVPKKDNPQFEELALFDRRRMLKNLFTLPVMGGFSYAVLKNFGYESFEEKDLKVNAVSSATLKFNNFAKLSDLNEQVPKGKIGSLEVSRMICGGNLIVGYAHARDLIYVSSLVKKYFTQEKIWETIRLCEACGVNTVLMRTAQDIITPLNKYRKQGGKIQWIAATYPEEKDLFSNTQLAIDSGADAVLIMGNTADRWISQGRIDLFEKWILHFQGKGIPIGVGAHELQVIKAMEDNKFPVDYYFKTLHSPNYWSYQADEPKGDVVLNKLDNYWCRDPEETISYMESVDKPWIAFKILAAGAIKPKDGFRYAFENGADFACVGLFDYQVVEDCNILTSTLKNITERKRKYFA